MRVWPVDVPLPRPLPVAFGADLRPPAAPGRREGGGRAGGLAHRRDGRAGAGRIPDRQRVQGGLVQHG